jgi:hypothetical protein
MGCRLVISPSARVMDTGISCVAGHYHQRRHNGARLEKAQRQLDKIEVDAAPSQVGFADRSRNLALILPPQGALNVSYTQERKQTSQPDVRPVKVRKRP